MQPTLSEVVALAKSAGEIVRAGYGQQHQVQYKGVIDLVTEIDHRSEDHILQTIRAKYPDHSIITEESGKLAGERDHRWYIDPLDGTVNYSHAYRCLPYRWLTPKMGRSPWG